MPERSTRPFWMGIDLGTQSVRAMAVAGDGDVLGVGTEKLSSHRDDARHEQNPADWWNGVTSACREALEGLDPSGAQGVAVDATSGTILLVDADGNPTTRGLMYDDMRGESELARINETGADVWERLGYSKMQASWGLPKLCWLLRERADLFKPGTRLLHQSDFINEHLAGDHVASDTSSALKTGCDLVHAGWPTDVMEALSVPPDLLPNVVRSGTEIGAVSSKAADATGLLSGTPIIAGMTDGCAAQMGAGALTPGSWNSILGTTLVLKGVTPDLVRDPGGVVYSHRAPDGNWLPGGASSTGAGILTKHFEDRDLDALNKRAADCEPASVVAYPLASPGERFPFIAPDAEEFVLGEPEDEIDYYAALLQGVAFIERLCFDYLAMLGAPTDGELRLTGGGTQSRYWCQLRADVLNRPVTLPENAEAALGMAVLAASPGRSVAEVASEMVRVREVIDPRPGHTAQFQEPYQRLVDELAQRGWLPDVVREHVQPA